MAGRDRGESLPSLSAEAGSKKKFAAALLLAAGAATAWIAASRLERMGRVLGRQPASPPAYYLAFAGAVLLAFVAGRLTTRREEPALEIVRQGAPGRGLRAVRAAATLACLLLFAFSWVQLRRWPAMGVLALWGACLAAGTLIFAGPRSKSAPSPRTGRSPVLWAALAIVLIIAAWARLTGLDRVPSSFGGDEANQVMDGIDLIQGRPPGDPFGIGWTGTVRLGMLPAAAGALEFSDLIAGPRRPYAIAGSLSVAAIALAAGVAAGPWAALSCAALLAFCPYHVHFSRLASVMILDALFASLTVLLLLLVHRSGSELAGYLAGVAAGLSLYGYAGGRAIALCFLLALPLLYLTSKKARARPWVLAAGLLLGFGLAAAPGLRFAANHWLDWRGRFGQVSIFAPISWDAQLRTYGSPAGALKHQFQLGTIGLLSMHTAWPWFKGYPILAPVVLPALSLAGFGWLLGRRRYFAAALPGLIAAANMAGVVLTESAPAPQRLSSLVPMLAFFAGTAVAGFLGLLPVRVAGEVPLRTAAGILAVGLSLVLTFRGAPDVWEASPGYAWAHGPLVTSAYKVLRAPRYDGERVFLHGQPNVDTSFPLFHYFLPRIQWVDLSTEEGNPPALPPGLHLFSDEWTPLARRWKGELGLAHAVALPHPENPMLDTGYLFRIR